jgi:acyl-coenzyme A synthetase/AMP-(fatty) acid ligase
MYGPTEITVDCTFHVVNELPVGEESSIPIGLPRRNMEVFVRSVDGTLSIAPGSEGEIAVRGKSVSYGYLNNAEKTRAAFIQNPRHDLYHDPIYLTGDLARIDEHGRFLYLGRKDRQVKFMGNRVELDEIEVALMRVEGVAEGVVVFNDAPSIADKCIAALVVLDEGVSTQDVAERLKEILPAYMVPRRIVAATEMPRNPNGKSDRLSAFRLIFLANH